LGHGTGESANIFAVAPDVQLLPVKCPTNSSGAILNATAGFNAAVGLNPDIITCSWGSNVQFGPLTTAQQTRAAAVAAAWASGIVVIFSAGNGNFGFPAQHPDVIAAGGVHMREDASIEASDYSSGFISNVYGGRRVPDVSGLVGMQPKAIYIMLPLEPGDTIDVGRSGGVFPNGDQTANNDGWAAFSGTSAAAPQLAGLAALIKQACSHHSPAAVRDIMMKTARDVTTGTCSPWTGGHPAAPGPDTATGHGLVDAYKAVLLAKIRCLSIRGRGIAREPVARGRIEPIRGGIEPVRGGIEPVRGGIEPVRGGIEPVRGGIEPVRGGIEPRRGIDPGPKASLEDASLTNATQEQGQPLSPEEVVDLEDMVIQSEINFGD
jgi:subtilisin family serine protease